MKAVKTLVLLALVFGAATLNSCNKKDVPPNTKINANVDGSTTAFNTNAKAAQGTVNGSTVTTIQGTASNGTILSIALTGPIIAGQTYSASANSPEGEPLLILSSSGTDFINDDSDRNLVSITITSVSSSSIEGTFKGNLVETNFAVNSVDSNLGTKAITNGSFNVKF